MWHHSAPCFPEDTLPGPLQRHGPAKEAARPGASCQVVPAVQVTPATSAGAAPQAHRKRGSNETSSTHLLLVSYNEISIMLKSITPQTLKIVNVDLYWASRGGRAKTSEPCVFCTPGAKRFWLICPRFDRFKKKCSEFSTRASFYMARCFH